MSKKLEVGTPVFILPCPTEMVHNPTDPGRLTGCSTGVLVEGPFPPGLYFTESGDMVRFREPAWQVDMDGFGPGAVIESLLVPLDGLEESEPTTHEEQVNA